jgi:hypothetical protein
MVCRLTTDNHACVCPARCRAPGLYHRCTCSTTVELCRSRYGYHKCVCPRSGCKSRLHITEDTNGLDDTK